MDYLDSDLLLYLVIIVVFLAFFIWSNRRAKKNRTNQKNRNFRKRYLERKHEREE